MSQPDVITISIRFGVDTILGLYQDTLYFTEDEWVKRDSKVIDQQKQELADTWVAFRQDQINTELKFQTEQGKLDKIAELDNQIKVLSDQKDQISKSLDPNVILADVLVG